MNFFARLRLLRAAREYDYGRREEAYRLVVSIMPDVIKEQTNGPPSQPQQSNEKTRKENPDGRH